jgi:glycosyltransferase involved in cell wall biosynthesis
MNNLEISNQVNKSLEPTQIERTQVQPIFPKITVLTTCYNHAQYIEATINSVINQGYPNLEYIVIDGGSTDGSIEIIQRYRNYLTTFLVEPNTLQIDKLVKGFKYATGDILCMLNSDDLFELGTFKEVVDFFKNNPQADVVYGDYSWINSEGKLIKRKRELSFNRFIMLYDINYIPQPSVFWRRELYDRIGGINPSLELAMDADLWLRFADVTTMYHINKFWSKYRIHPQQKSSNYREKMVLEMRTIRQRYVNDESAIMFKIKSAIARGIRLVSKSINGHYF